MRNQSTRNRDRCFEITAIERREVRLAFRRLVIYGNLICFGLFLCGRSQRITVCMHDRERSGCGRLLSSDRMMIRLLGFSASIKNREEKIVRNYYDLWRFLNDETYEPCRLMILDVR